MSGALQLSSTDRVLVLAPHPDDETLAAGDLIRAALAAGCALRVAFATDGDNNPWPQRWLERRWKIGVRERARWGARRRGEARAALERLGVPQSAAPARFFGWPDQGLTALLMRDDRAIEALAQEIAQFAPTHLVLPNLADRHPDHSALRVLAELALLRSGHRCLCLGYVVHGEKPSGDGRMLEVPAADAQAKREAMHAHASQLALSRKRLLGLAALPNRFELLADEAVAPPDATQPLRVPRARSLRPHDLLLLVAWPGEVARVRLPLPRAPGEQVATDARGREYAIDVGARELRLQLPAFESPPAAIYAKVHRCDPRLLIFDREPWRRAADASRASSVALTGPIQSGYI
jgi:LmbE family N-acetylglucosaminyl deacetylase